MIPIRATLLHDLPTDDAAALCGQLRSGRWMVEAGGEPPPRHEPRVLLAGEAVSGAMALSLTSATVLRLDLGSALVGRLAALRLVVDPLAGLALHELITNAAVHGNLAVASGRAADWGDLSHRREMTAMALDDPSRAARLVTVVLGWRDAEVVVVVADEGAGYDMDAPRESPRAAGRGLRLARAAGRVEVGDGGRRTAITMPIQAKSTPRSPTASPMAPPTASRRTAPSPAPSLTATDRR